MSTTKIRTSVQVLVDADLDVNSKKITSLATPTLDTDAATKAYVDGILAANDAMQYKGVIDCSTEPNYPAANAGDTYKASVTGKIGGASGHAVTAGDMIVCTADSTAAGTEAAVGAFWNVIHTNAGAGAVSSSSTSVTDNSIVRMDGTPGSVIQTSLVTVDDNGSVNIPAGQAYKINGTSIAVNFVTCEAVTGTKNGTNPTFTLAHTPTLGSVMLFLNGQLLEEGAGNDYTISGDTITKLTVMVISTDKLVATYRY